MASLVAAVLMAATVLGPAMVLGDSPVRLAEPAAGAVLVPGRTVTIAWEPTAAWPAAAEVPIEEWEAFLSVNGGQSYTYRITPHLDADLATFHFMVPGVVSDDVRILIRLGDERHEVAFEMPQRFSIAGAGSLLSLRQASSVIPDREPDTKRGRAEAARPGDAGVRMWVEGDRRGGNLRLETATDGSSVCGRSLRQGDLRLNSFLTSRRQRSGAPSSATALQPVHLADDRADTPAPLAVRAASILLLIQRSNR